MTFQEGNKGENKGCYGHITAILRRKTRNFKGHITDILRRKTRDFKGHITDISGRKRGFLSIKLPLTFP